jgi:hypothetical protein
MLLMRWKQCFRSRIYRLFAVARRPALEHSSSPGHWLFIASSQRRFHQCFHCEFPASILMSASLKISVDFSALCCSYAKLTNSTFLILFLVNRFPATLFPPALPLFTGFGSSSIDLCVSSATLQIFSTFY